MSDTNGQTLASYNAHVAEYVSGTNHDVAGASKDWIDAALDGLPTDAAILEIGSAFGRDAAYMQAQGYTVACTDAAASFVDHLNGIGMPARLFNVLTDDFDQAYDLVFADAVLLHFNPVEFAGTLARTADALKPSGRFAFCLKRGHGEEWSTHKLKAPRYFCYWQPEALPDLLADAGFASWAIDAVDMDRSHANWIFVIARV